MVEISDNFPYKGIPEICSCGESEIMAHIYNCEKLNNEKYPMLKYEYIYTGGIHEQITVFKKFEEYLNERENLKFPLAPMGVLAPGSAHARPSTRPPIDTSGIFLAK